MNKNAIRIYTTSGACSPRTVPCNIKRGSQQWIDPCSCSAYYECVNVQQVLRRSCPAGTAWYKPNQACGHENVIVPKLCDPKKPWARCPPSTWKNFRDIKCFNKVMPVAARRRPATQSNVGGDLMSQGITGTIAAVVSGIVFVLIIVLILLILWWTKWRVQSKGEKPQQTEEETTAAYYEGPVYAEIGDTINSSQPLEHSSQSGPKAYGVKTISVDVNTHTSNGTLVPPPRILTNRNMSVPYDHGIASRQSQSYQGLTSAERDARESHDYSAISDNEQDEWYVNDDSHRRTNVSRAVNKLERGYPNYEAHDGGTEPEYFIIEPEDGSRV